MPADITSRGPVGVLGGMFDPVHSGHLQAAKAACEFCHLDHVLLIPCGIPVHRERADASAAQRCDMLRLAIGATDWLALDTRECRGEGPNRTFDTLKALRSEYPGQALCLIIGLDQFLNFHTWYRWRDILDLTHLAVITRPGYTLADGIGNPELRDECARRMTRAGNELARRDAGLICLVEAATAPWSSTMIRDAVRQGRETAEMLPAGVRDYIHKHGLYHTNGAHP